MNNLQEYILNEIKQRRLDAKKGATLIREASKGEVEPDKIAIIGIGLRMPQADNKEEFWEILCNKADTIRKYPKTRHDLTDPWLSENDDCDNAYQIQGYLDQIAMFDEGFFDLSSAEARKMNPLQRMFMECSYEALEDAGYGGENLKASKTAVYVGAAELGQPRYQKFLTENDGLSFIGNANSIIPSRLSYYLGLEGTSVALDSACSSGLLGVHMACESLKTGECNTAVVCGANLNFMPLKKDKVSMLESPESQIYPFGIHAKGTVWGEGVGVVVLKGLKQAVKDKDRIYAVICGNGANNDGNSNGITAPKMQMQQALFEEVWKKNHIDAQQICYVEAHGTGTELGDPIEIKSLSNAIKKYTNRKQFCGIGTAKAGIGHLVAASGLAALIKSALSLYYGEIPPMRGFVSPNSHINFTNSPFYVSDEPIKLDPENGEEKIAVNSFGISGTNVHLVLEKTQVYKVRPEEKESILLISAKSERSLELLLERYAMYLENTKESMQDICYSAWKGRGHYIYRVAFVGGSVNELSLKIRDTLRRKANKEKMLSSGCFMYSMEEEACDSKLYQMASDYVQRKKINCEELYTEQCRMTDIPVYVFDEHILWPKYVDRIETTEESEHGWCCKVKGIYEDDWMMDLDESNWIFEEHCVGGKKILPATAMLNYLVTVASHYNQMEHLKIEKFVVLQPVQGEGKRQFQIFVGKKDNPLTLALYVYNNVKETWDKVAMAKAAFDKFNTMEAPEVISISGGEVNANEFTHGKITYGNRWICIRNMQTINDEVRVELNLDQRYKNDLEYFVLHPALLDMALNGVALQLDGNYLPFSCSTASIVRKLPRHFYSSIRRKITYTDELISYEITMFDEDGMIAYFDDYAVKKVNENILSGVYQLSSNWIETDKLQYLKDSIPESSLVFTDNQRMCEEILGIHPYIKYVPFYVEDSKLKKILQTNSYEKVIIMSETSLKEVDEKHIQEQTKNYIAGIYHILRNASAVKQVVTVTMDSFDGKQLEPMGEAINTLMRSAQNEFLKSFMKHISCNKAGSQALLAELANKTDRETILYENRRFVSEISENLCTGGKKVELKTGGYYIVTGGSGGLATILEKELIENKCNVISVSRSGKTDSKLLEEAKKRKVDFTGFSTDVSDAESIKELENYLISNIGHIDGIFHLAGVAGHHFISQDDHQNDEKVWNTKILGTYYLSQLMEHMDIPLLVCYSSVSALIGTPGQSNYAVGNAFMDGMSKKISKQGRTAISIQWPALSGVGMAAINNATYDSIFLEMEADETIRDLKKILSLGSGVYCIVPLNYQFKLVDKMSWNLNTRILHRFHNQNNSRKESQGNKVVLKGRPDGVYTEMEKVVGKIWSEVLEVEELDIDKEYYELGGNSITAIDTLTKLNDEIETEIEIAKLFQYTTVRKLAGYLGNKEETVEPLQEYVISQKRFYEMSSEQKQIYSICVLQPQSTVYNLPIILNIKGDIDVEKMEQAYAALVNRHSSLRTQFVMHESNIMQQVKDNVQVSFEYESAHESELDEIRSQFVRPFNLEVAPLIRMKLIRFNEKEHILMIDLHHIICDGYSSIVLVKEFLLFYETGIFDRESNTYTEYSERLRKKDWGKEFWMKEFEGEIPVLNLPSDWQRESMKSFRGNSIDFKYSAEIREGVEKLALSCKCSRFMVILAATYITLSKYSNQNDIIVGVPNIGNRSAEYKNTIGMFVNTLPVRVQIRQQQNVEELLGQIKEKCMNIFQHPNLNYEEFLSSIQYIRDISRNPLYDVMVVYQNMEDNEFEVSDSGMGNVHIERKGYTVTSCPFICGTSKMDITLEVHEKEDGYHIAIHYADTLFLKETINRIAGSLEQVLKSMIQSMDTQISGISVVSEEEEELISRFNQTETSYPDNITVDQIFRQQAMKTPMSPAVWSNGQSLSYQELNRRSEELACYLQHNGVGPDSIIGVFCERSFEMIIGIYGILKAGGAYMPIGVEFPAERINYIMENSGAKYLIVQNKEWMEKLNCNIDIYKIDLSDESIFLKYKNETAISRHDKNNLCYVIYTSGTTGNPKGVMIEHHSIVNRIFWMQKKFPISSKDRILQKTTYTFDVSVWEMLWWSFFGASVVMLEPGGEKVPEVIVKTIKEYQVSVIHFVPSMFNVFVEYVIAAHQQQDLKSLNIVFTSGEELKSEKANYFIEQIASESNIQLVNKYGPTEAAVDVTYYECKGNEKVIPIGKPIDNIKIYILDQSLNQVPVGVSGVLYISGVGVGRGYLNNQKLTSEKFIKNPFEANQVMYNTGDLARWKKDGNIEYLGRCDHQVKIKGFRIELEEIETRLMECSGVLACLVKDIERNGQKTLCAYLRTNEQLEIDKIKSDLYSVLPGYMVPDYYVQMDKFPLTINGKIDRNALPMPEKIEREIIKANSELEKMMVEIWSQVLQANEISVVDNFYDLGGDSIKAIQIQIELEKKGYYLNIRNIMQYPILKILCNHLKIKQESALEYTVDAQWIRQEAEILEKDASEIENVYRLTAMQEGILMYYQMNPKSTAYFEQFDFTLEGNVDVEMFKNAVQLLSEKYGVLRTVFTQDTEGKACQVILKPGNQIPFYVVENCEKDYVEEFKEGDRNKGLEITDGETWRITILELQNDVCHVIWDMHHIIVDGWSEMLLWNELFMLYKQLIENKEVQLEPEVGYFHFVNWMIQKQKDYPEAEEYWKNYLSGYSKMSTIPSITEQKEGYLFCKDTRKLPKVQFNRLKEIACINNITTNQLFQAVWAAMLYYYNGEGEVVFGVVNSGRHVPVGGMDQMVGLLLNTMPLRARVKEKMSIIDIAKQLKEDVVYNLEYSYYPLYKIQQLCSVNSLFDHIIVYQNFPRDFIDENMDFGDFTMKTYQLRDETTYDFNITIAEWDDELVVTFKYNGCKYDNNTMNNLWEKIKVTFEMLCTDDNCNVESILQELDKDAGFDDLYDDLL